MNRQRENNVTLPANCAEWLLDLGRCVNKQMKRGAGIEEVARQLFANPEHCKLALVLYRASDVFKLRAMVEDWKWERLVSELGGLYRAAGRREQAGTR